MAGRRGQALKPDDVRAMLRLCHELHEVPPEPLARKTHLLESLCRLLPADEGTGVVAHPPVRSNAVGDGAGAAAMPVVLAAVHVGDVRSAPARAAPPVHAPPPWRRLLRGGRARVVATRHARGHALHSLVPLDGDGRLVACLSVRRPGPRRPAFTPRDFDLVHLLHLETGWVYRHDLPPAAAPTPALTRRQRDTLHLLLAGLGEKQIAARLRLSANTVHVYVKALYRRFGVSSRSELLARYVREGEGEVDPVGR